MPLHQQPTGDLPPLSTLTFQWKTVVSFQAHVETAPPLQPKQNYNNVSLHGITARGKTRSFILCTFEHRRSLSYFHLSYFILISSELL